jgi:carboxymethylenebutenolidase
VQRQDRCRRVLLRRHHRQHDGGADTGSRRSVPFYGAQPTAAEAARIKSPLLLHYAALDERINAGWPAYEAALKENGVRYQMFMYPGTNHGFHNDTTPRYDAAAAKLAWSRTIDFLKQNLKT